MFKKIFLLLLIAGAVVTGCSKDEKEKDTEITVYLKDIDGTPLNQWVVYGYSQTQWTARSVVAKQSATDANGKASFVLSEIDIRGGQEVYRFVVYYTKTRTNILGDKVTSEMLEKIVPITIKRGENQTIEMKLD